MIPIIPNIAPTSSPSVQIIVPSTIPLVPFYSQFKDIHAASWQKVGCGIASLAMIINYYSDEDVQVDTLLQEGIDSGSYDIKSGWIHKGLISLSKEYGLTGTSHDVSSLSKDLALKRLKTELKEGPVIVSVHYKFDPKSTTPHLVVLDGIDENGTIYYNDPAAKVGQKKISTSDFQRGWKKRYIVIRPTLEKISTV